MQSQKPPRSSAFGTVRRLWREMPVVTRVGLAWLLQCYVWEVCITVAAPHADRALIAAKGAEFVGLLLAFGGIIAMAARRR